MKIFKLIKPFPRSPKLGTMVKYVEDGAGSYGIIGTGVVWYSREEIENFPEFWEQTKAAYEIVSLHHKEQNNLINIQMDGCYTADLAPYSVEQGISSLETILFALRDGVVKIHSVKRLSDGQIFSIGDVIRSTKWSLTRSGKVVDPIRKIYIATPGHKGIAEKDDIILETKITWRTDLESAVKMARLGTTEDGVDVYENEEYWCINTHSPNEEGLTPYSNKQTKEDTSFSHGWIKKFSTERRARAFVKKLIEKRKIVLITHDGVPISIGDSYCYIDTRYLNRIEKVEKALSTGGVGDHYIYFSSLVKAKDWLLMNKPCFSINDFLEVVGDISLASRETLKGAAIMKLN